MSLTLITTQEEFHLEPGQTSKMEFSAVTFLAKSLILPVGQGSKYASVTNATDYVIGNSCCYSVLMLVNPTIKRGHKNSKTFFKSTPSTTEANYVNQKRLLRTGPDTLDIYVSKYKIQTYKKP